MKESSGVVIWSRNAASHLQRLSPLRAKGERRGLPRWLYLNKAPGLNPLAVNVKVNFALCQHHA